MNRCTRLLVLAGLSFASRAGAQLATPNPKDVASADAIVAALYDANIEMVDQKHGADRFRSLFIPDGRLMPTVTRPNGIPALITIRTVEGYIQQAMSGQPRHGFSEREVARTSQAFGNIMQVFSTYETKRDSNDTHPIHGINSIQLFNDGTRWWVVGVLWDNERPDKPIPPVFLKSSKSP